ncbi:DUF1801 domain-containing protein [Pseudooceanicola sp. LIPI14-2-Ac024]|uniref:DUF1801 domain-containing protein n=1 Tax=Pseudooceanicola sp. LIPI14-2-Ac024 TaxID=3344875 RepID=UPI0035D02A9A
MAENKTVPTGADVRAFLDAVEPPRRRAQGLEMLAFFEEITGYPARMWGDSIVGFGRYAYRYDSGHSGEFLATGFSPRKTALTLYIMPGYQDYGAILDRLGPHKLGKSCLYITRLDQVDRAALTDLVQQGLKDLNAIWPVHPE